MNRRIKGLGVFLLAAALAATLLCPIAAADFAASGVGGRRIAIVLDNSNSMIINEADGTYSSRWAEATYALRTFIHMVKDTDAVKLFTVAALSGDNMDQQENEDAATVSEDCVTAENIDEQLHNVGISYQTKTYGMDAAYSWAADGAPGAERWVVILSDGKFYPKNTNLKSISYTESVGEGAIQGNLRNVRTIFVGLDVDNEDLEELREQRIPNLSIHNTYSIEGTGEKRSIEETILEISEKIYGMRELDHDRILASAEFAYGQDQDASTLTWATQPGLSAYLDQVIIIAQTDLKDDEAPKTPADPKMQIIESDHIFSWCFEEALDDIVTEHDKHAGPTFDFGSSDVFQEKIVDTFLKKYCYIRSYSSAEIGDQIEFQVPPGEYTYRIYYELKESVVPELVLEQGGATVPPYGEKVYRVTEGPARIGFRLNSENAENIPKTLEAVKDALAPVFVAGEESAGEIDFTYNDTSLEENRYQLSVAFNGKTTEATVETMPALQNYSFLIPKGQVLNIDQPNDNQITIETTLPFNWLNNHLAGNITTTPERPEFTLGLEDARVIEVGDGINAVTIPVHCSTSPFNLSENFPIEVVFSIEEGVNGQLKAGGSLSARPGHTEISLNAPDAGPNLVSPAAKPVLYMTARTDHDVTQETALHNVTVTGLGILEGVLFQYNETEKRIEYAGSLGETWRLLSSGVTSGTVRVEGEVYRRDIQIDSHFEQTAEMSWSGSIKEWIGVFALIIACIVVLFVLFILTYTGKLLFQELIDRMLFIVFEKKFPLYWNVEDGENGKEITINKGAKWYPWKLCLAFRMISEDKLSERDDWIALKGTKNGYYMTQKSENILDRLGIVCTSEGYGLDKDHPELVFEYTNDEGKTYHIPLRFREEIDVNRFPGACVICILAAIVLLGLCLLPLEGKIGLVLALIVVGCLFAWAFIPWLFTRTYKAPIPR